MSIGAEIVMTPDLVKRLATPAKTKIIMLILDGLGGLPRQPGGKTELETARTPNLDALAAQSTLGLSIPVAPGITPGSGPGHLALFGYDPIQYEIGRGAMEALGVDFELGVEDLAARGNFCSVDGQGLITDRRAGRIPTSTCLELAEVLETIQFDGVQVFIRPVKEHRFAFIMRGPELHASLTDTDPQLTGVTPLPVRALDSQAEKSASLVNQFLSQAGTVLAHKHPANMVLLRGFARLPVMPAFKELYGLNAAAIALHGMYRGVAQMVGMRVLPVDGMNLEDEFTCLEKHFAEYDFFYLHIKKTDTYGEMGDFDRKVSAIEEVDTLLPRLLSLQPDVVIVSGDHSSPAILKSHSWHPVPTMIYSHFARADGIADFGETACKGGGLGLIPAKYIMPLALANANRLAKYGA